jgi:co-chaperonin GroES (HSP10)
MKIPHLFNEKIAVRQLSEDIEGSIILPENRVLKFEIGEVTATGNGVYRDGTKRDMWVKPGDVVMYQLGGPQIENSKFKLDGKSIKIFHQGDCIATLDKTPQPDSTAKVIVKKETFHIMGNWVLLEVILEQGLIITPEKCAPSEDFKFTVAQIGQGVTLPIKVGQQVYPERGRCLPVEITGTTYVYTHQDFLHGALTEISDPEITDEVPTSSEPAA